MAIFTSSQCTIPISRLLNPPYSYTYGTSVYVKISAINVIGSSAYSSPANGAIVLATPDAPINLANVPS